MVATEVSVRVRLVFERAMTQATKNVDVALPSVILNTWDTYDFLLTHLM